MALPQRRVDLEAMGYRYNGEGHCRGCGVLMLWFITPNQKKMPMTIKTFKAAMYFFQNFQVNSYTLCF